MSSLKIECKFSGKSMDVVATNDFSDSRRVKYSCVYELEGGITDTISGESTITGKTTSSIGGKTGSDKVISVKSSSISEA